MAVICPAVLATNPKSYNKQLVEVATFADRLHLDVMDGQFAPTRSPELGDVVLPTDKVIDFHVMYEDPLEILDELIACKPHLVIVHAEAQGSFATIAQKLHDHGIKAGVALLAKTPIDTIQPALELIDHVLVFSGELGKFGGEADLKLADKAEWCKEMKPGIEVGWDGGVDDINARELVEAGVDVLNVGGFIQKAKNPKESYQRLQNLIH